MVNVVIALPVKSLTAAEFRALFELPFTQAVAKVVNVSAQHVEVHQFADGARVVLVNLTVSTPASKGVRVAELLRTNLPLEFSSMFNHMSASLPSSVFLGGIGILVGPSVTVLDLCE